MSETSDYGYEALTNRVLVLFDRRPDEITTESGILLSGAAAKGDDVAHGTVVGAGPDVTTLKVGDRVYTGSYGGLAILDPKLPADVDLGAFYESEIVARLR